MNSNARLSEVPWMGYFRIGDHGLFMQKSALVKGVQIGAFDLFGNLHWFEKEMIVIIL